MTAPDDVTEGVMAKLRTSRGQRWTREDKLAIHKALVLAEDTLTFHFRPQDGAVEGIPPEKALAIVRSALERIES